MKITVIINGVGVPVKTTPKAKLITVMSKARKDSNNIGRPVIDWDIYTAAGDRLDTTQTVEALNLKDGSRVFMNLGVGAGG